MRKFLNKLCSLVYLPIVWVAPHLGAKGYGGPVRGGGWYHMVRFRKTNIFLGYYQPMQKWFSKKPRRHVNDPTTLEELYEAAGGRDLKKIHTAMRLASQESKSAHVELSRVVEILKNLKGE